MKNKFKTLFKITFFYLLTICHAYSNEFNFNTSEIKILDNGNIINATNGIATSKDDGIEIEADKFQYIKNLSTIKATGNIKIVNLDNDILIKSQNIIYNIADKKVESVATSTIEDNLGNFVSMEGFVFNLNDNLIKLEKTKLIDTEKNILEIDLAFLNLKSKKLIGKDVSINFNTKGFDKDNEPRLKGSTLTSDDDNSIIKNGIFTTCKKNDNCPPWQLQANKVRHDKKNKIMYYDNAWLKIYDRPVLYFPKFFHPDPTVKRQSGFLMPTFNDSSSLGSSFNIPYFHIISESKDFTLSPRIYNHKKALIQSEYRSVGANSSHLFDLSFMGEKDANSTSHFFSKSTKKIDFFEFDESEISLDIQSTSNDTYLKTYKIKSPIIDSTNNLTNSLGISAYREDLTFSADFKIFEDLNKKKSDRYEYILPTYNLNKQIENDLDLLDGNLSFNSSGFIKNYDTNIFEKSIINDLIYDSNFEYSRKGLQKNYKVLLKNVNTDSKNSKKYKEKRDHTLRSQFQYNLSYPLKKDGNNYKEILNPITSFKFSPNKSKNNRDSDVRIDVDNIFSFNRIASEDSVEGGSSLAYGLEYSRLNMEDKKILGAKIAAQARLEEDNNLSINSSLGQKSSNILGSFDFNPYEMLNLEYKFSLDENLADTNYQSLASEIRINNFITSFEYVNENSSISTNSYLTNETSYAFNDSKKLLFKTRTNKETDATEYYNLIYQYRNDCLIAALEYNKEYYNDGDLKPDESIFFKLTIIPFGQTSTPNLK